MTTPQLDKENNIENDTIIGTQTWDQLPQLDKEPNCTYCYDKGYSTRAFQEKASADFIGDEGYSKEPNIEKIPCKKCQPSEDSGQLDWKERFDEMFKPPEICLQDCHNEGPRLKQFIAEEIERAREETLNEVIEMVEGMKSQDLKWDDLKKNAHLNRSLDKLLNQLKEKRDE